MSSSVVPSDPTPFVTGFPAISTRIIYGQWVYTDGTGVDTPPTIEYVGGPYFLTPTATTLFAKKQTATMADASGDSTVGVWYAEVIVYNDPDLVGDVRVRISHPILPGGSFVIAVPSGSTPLNVANALAIQGSTGGLLVITGTGGSVTGATIDDSNSSTTTVYSSGKVVTLLTGKADASALAAKADASALAAKADASTVVTLSTTQSITGTKTFTASPVVPTPTTDTQAANKAYVDANVGTGTGGTAPDTSSTLTTGTPSTTAPWTASNTKTQINALLGTTGGVEQVQDIVGAFLQGGTYNDSTNTYVLPSGGVSNSAPLDASSATYGMSTSGTAAANGAALLAAVQAAGKRPVTAASGRYLCDVTFADEDINLDMPGVTLVQPANSPDPIITVERTTAITVSLGPTRVVEFGPRTPGGVSSSAKYTALDLSSGGYANWQAGDLGHIFSRDIHPWSWTYLGIANYGPNPNYTPTPLYDGYFYQAAYVPILGIALTVNAITNGGPQEQMMVQGSTSGAQGLVMSDLIGNSVSGSSITATQKHILFAKVTGDFVAGETLTRIAGGNPQSATGETIATVGQAIGTVSGSPFLVANRLLDDAYGVVTAANITAGGTYGPGTRYPVQTDNTVRLRRVDRTKICNVRAQFDIEGTAGAQDAYVTAANRTDMIKFRGVFQPVFEGRVYNSWTRAVCVTSCFGGRFRAIFDGLPNHAFLDQSAFGYGYEVKCASEGNVFELIGRNLRHAFTTNPNGRTWSTSNNNAILDYGTPKYNTVQNSVVLASYTNSYDTHPGDYYTRFINCVAIGGGSGGRYNSDGGAQFASRGFGTSWIDCRSVNSVEGINYLGGEHDPGFDHTVVVRNCDVTRFQSRGFFATDAITNHATVIIDGGRYMGDGSVTNQQYQHEGLAIGKGIKVIIKGEVEVGGFNGFWLRMREAGTAGIQSELDIISALVDYRGSTTTNAQGLRVDGTLARAVIDGLRLRLADGTTPGGVITNRGGTTAFRIGRITPLNTSGTVTLPLFQVASQGGTPTYTTLTDVVSIGGGGSSGTQVTVDGTPVSTLDISSTPVVDALYLGSDVTTGLPTAGTTLADLTQLQKSIPVGSYIFEADLYFQMSATGTGALRFGFGGAGSTGATLAAASAFQCTNPSTNTMLSGVLSGLGVAGATATQGTNVFGISPGVAAATVWVKLKGRVLVTTAGVLGVTWALTTGATAVPTLKAGSFIEFRKIT